MMFRYSTLTTAIPRAKHPIKNCDVKKRRPAKLLARPAVRNMSCTNEKAADFTIEIRP